MRGSWPGISVPPRRMLADLLERLDRLVGVEREAERDVLVDVAIGVDGVGAVAEALPGGREADRHGARRVARREIDVDARDHALDVSVHQQHPALPVELHGGEHVLGREGAARRAVVRHGRRRELELPLLEDELRLRELRGSAGVVEVKVRERHEVDLVERDAHLGEQGPVLDPVARAEGLAELLVDVAGVEHHHLALAARRAHRERQIHPGVGRRAREQRGKRRLRRRRVAEAPELVEALGSARGSGAREQ